MSGNPLTLTGAGFGAGKFGQAITAGTASGGVVTPAVFTLEAWIKPSSSTSALGVAFCFAGSFFVGVLPENGGLALQVASDVAYTHAAISADTWHHVALARSGNAVKIWLDGVLAGHTISSAGDGALCVGNFSAGGSYPFTGAVDEVALWSGVRYSDAGFTPPASPYSGSAPNLVALHHLDGDGADASGTTAGLAIGALTAIGTTTGVALSLSAGLSGGSGAGYLYAIYRGTDPNFTVGAGSLLTTQASLPYVDATAPAGTSYYYGVIGSDGAGTTVNALPAGLSALASSPSTLLYAEGARLISPSLAVVFIGTSVTNGAMLTNAGSSAVETAPAMAGARLRRLGGRRQVAVSNQGVSGSTATQWQPGGGYYNAAKAAMTALLTADPGATPVFHIELGTNDTPTQNGALSPTAFRAVLKPIIDQLLVDFANAQVVVSRSLWYSPTTHNTATYEQAGLSAGRLLTRRSRPSGELPEPRVGR